MKNFEHFKKNLIPGILLWFFSLSLIYLYYNVLSIHQALEQLGQLKERFGIGYSIFSTMLFGGVIPFIYLSVKLKKVAPALSFYLIYWAYKGAEVDLLYRAQSLVFGADTEVATIAKKVIFDQFIYSPIWSAPSIYFVYKWKDLGYSFKKLLPHLKLSFYQRELPHILLSTWMVWVPAVIVIYSFPPSLQIPLFNFVLCFWSLVLEILLRTPEQR